MIATVPDAEIDDWFPQRSKRVPRSHQPGWRVCLATLNGTELANGIVSRQPRLGLPPNGRPLSIVVHPLQTDIATEQIAEHEAAEPSGLTMELRLPQPDAATEVKI